MIGVNPDPLFIPVNLWSQRVVLLRRRDIVLVEEIDEVETEILGDLLFRRSAKLPPPDRFPYTRGVDYVGRFYPNLDDSDQDQELLDMWIGSILSLLVVENRGDEDMTLYYSRDNVADIGRLLTQN